MYHVSVLQGAYPQWQGQPYIYVNPALDQGEIAAYLNWIRSADGQKVVKDAGYFPVPENLRTK